MDGLELAPSRLLCPKERYEKDKDGKVITVSGQIHHIIKSSYRISDVEDERFKHLDHSLLRRNKKEVEGTYLSCPACREEIKSETYYYCNCCNKDYHKECIESPSMIQSSDHPKHPLQLMWFPQAYFTHNKKCFSCRNDSGNLFYYCSVCDFMVHSLCARNSTPLTLQNPKRHEHTLHYFPRRKSTLTCDVCALEDDMAHVYVCLLCDFIVHKRCVYFPNVIKVSRHNHRLKFTPNLPNEEWINCGVCHTKVDVNYGQYSCTRGCVYALHSKCAMRTDVCDGKELEEEPEETYENINMYEEKGDGNIQHLSHPRHQMRLDKRSQRVYDENKRCQACRLPFYGDGNEYWCMQCDFVLHESCAYIPRIVESMLHIHPLVLKFDYTSSGTKCVKCYRYSFGFTYECLRTCTWVIDTICASICEPLDYHAHPHPLYITYDENTSKDCSVCQSSRKQPWNCIECNFVLCFGCATLPHKTRYENDEHLLTFTYKEDANDDEVYGCEICENDIKPKEGLYACNECGVTLHIDCILGKDPYMQVGESFTLMESQRSGCVLTNTCSTRPICKQCKRRCPYKIKIESSFNKDIFCSIHCYEECLYKGIREKMQQHAQVLLAAIRISEIV